MESLVIEISDLANRPGARKSIRMSQVLGGMGGPLARIEETDPVHLDLSAESVKEGILVSGEAVCRLRLSCSRCLAGYEQGFEQRIDEVFYLDEYKAVEMDGYRIENMSIDLEQMLRDVLVLGMPINPLHSPECRGLCPVCGEDLNVSDCGHSRATVDPRWGPLQAMLSDGRDA